MKEEPNRGTLVALCAAALLLAVPVAVQAQNWDVTVTGTITGYKNTDDVGGGEITGVDVGVALYEDNEVIGTGGVFAYVDRMDTTKPTLYDLRGATVFMTGAPFTGDLGAAGVLTVDTSFSGFLLGDITISGAVTPGSANCDVRGFFYAGATPFVGYINALDNGLDFLYAPSASANITVTNNGEGNAMGVLFHDGINAQDIWLEPYPSNPYEFSIINFGDINVTSKNDAWGFWAGDIGGGAIWVQLGNITVTAIDTTAATAVDHATGIQLGTAGQVPWEPIFMQTGNITVETDRLNAFGVHADSLYLSGDTGYSYFYNFGTITVTSTNTSANALTAGIAVQDYSEICLAKDITVSAKGGDAWGIRAGDLAIRADDNFTIGVSGADNNIGVEANVLALFGNGTADLGKVIANGNVIIGTPASSGDLQSVTVVVAEGSEFHGIANELHEGTSLKLNFASPEGIVNQFGAFDVTDGTLLSASGTEYYFDQDSLGDWHIFARPGLVGSDAFLAASTIHNRYTAYTMVRDKFISSTYRYGEYFGQAPCNTRYGLPRASSAGSTEGKGTSWVNYVGRADTYGLWNLGADGIQVGSDLYVTQTNQFGVIFGYEGGWAINNNDRVKSDDLYVGLYAAHIFRNNTDFRFIYNYGWQNFDMARDGGVYLSNFKGHTQEFNVEWGKRWHSGNWSCRPDMAMDFYVNHLDAAVEANGVSYDRLNTTQWFLRLGADLRYQAGKFTFTTGLSYAYDVINPDLSTRANGRVLQGARRGREIVMCNISSEYQFNRNLSVFGGYDLHSGIDRNGSDQHIGYIGGMWKW